MSKITTHDVYSLTEQLAELMRQHHSMLATAESCTGGWVAKTVTDLTGSSEWFECAIVTYTNRAKHDLLGVESSILDKYGAVSEQTVKAMVLGLLDRCHANVGVAISGIAGPGGGTDEKPVGTVWMAWARPGQLIDAVKFQFAGDREAVRLQAVYAALTGVKQLIENEQRD